MEGKGIQSSNKQELGLLFYSSISKDSSTVFISVSLQRCKRALHRLNNSYLLPTSTTNHLIIMPKPTGAWLIWSSHSEFTQLNECLLWLLPQWKYITLKSLQDITFVSCLFFSFDYLVTPSIVLWTVYDLSYFCLDPLLDFHILDPLSRRFSQSKQMAKGRLELFDLISLCSGCLIPLTSTQPSFRISSSPQVAAQPLDVIAGLSSAAVLIELPGTDLTAATVIGHPADARWALWE